jgi:ribonuclease I
MSLSLITSYSALKTKKDRKSKAEGEMPFEEYALALLPSPRYCVVA